MSSVAWGFASKYRITLLLWLTLLGFGAFSYFVSLPREGFPSVAIPTGIVRGTYFVDDQTRVDQDVARPLSQLFETTDFVSEYQISSGPNFYSAVVTFEDGVESSEGIGQLEKDISLLDLPDAATTEYVSIEPAKINNRYSALIGVYDAPDSSQVVLAEQAQVLAGELMVREGIASAEVLPVFERVLNPNNGQFERRQTRVDKLGLRQSGQTNVYPSVTVAVTRTDDIDDLELDQILGDVLAGAEERNLLNGVKATITADFATNVNEQIASLQNNLLGGLAAVILVALLLISWRAALVIALFIPTVLAATFAGLDLLGLTLNTVTLFAAILTLGLFVDDATIVVEAIDTHRRDRARQKKIITSAISRIGVATVAGTLTTVLVFAPMLMVSGILGDFIRLLPITVIVALFVSLAVSIIVVPFLSRWLVLGGQRSSFLDRFKLLSPLEQKLGRLVSNLPSLLLVKRRRGRLVRLMMIELSVLALIGAGIFASQLPFEIFPKTKDTNYLRSTVQFAPNTSIADAQAITNTIDDRISQAVGEELTYITYLQANERLGVIEIGLTNYRERAQTSRQLVDELISTGTELDGAAIKYSQLDVGPPAEDFPFQMRVFASQEQLQPLASAVAQFAKNAPLGGATVAEVQVNPDGTINRAEQGQYVDVLARFSTDESLSANVIELENQIKEEFNAERLAQYGATEQSLNFDISQENDNAESFASMGQGIIVALVAMYVLLVMLFDSFLQPLLILLAVPFGLFGVFFGLTVTDNSLSFFSMLGIMGLIGIAVNNSIMLTEYANQERASGSTRHQAITNALRDRFRALITTTTTTVVALLPLALSDPFWQPLAVTIIFGIVSSTLLIILAFPYYYLGLERLRDWAHERFASAN